MLLTTSRGVKRPTEKLEIVKQVLKGELQAFPGTLRVIFFRKELNCFTVNVSGVCLINFYDRSEKSRR